MYRYTLKPKQPYFNLNLIFMKLKMINGGGYSAPKIYEYTYSVEAGFQISTESSFEDLDFEDRVE